MGDGLRTAASSAPCDHETEDAMQSYGRYEERAPLLTHTDPSRTAHHRQPDTPARPGRNRREQTKPCHTVSHNVNTMLLQCAPNLFNLLLIYTTNANATINLTVTVLHDFELKRDTVQPKNYLPAQ